MIMKGNSIMSLALYLLLPFIYMVAFLPFRAMYLLSDITYLFIFHLIGYRRKVVRLNLVNSFPGMSEREINKIEKRFYRYFCDLLFETLKTLTITPVQLKDHVTFQNASVFKKFYDKKQSVIIVMGHMGNWELAGARFGVENLHKLNTIYHPLSNTFFENLIVKMRTRLGNGLYPMNEAYKRMLQDKDQVTATAFIADQSPSPRNAYWMTFLNQDTPVFLGTEKLAKKLNYPVLYVSLLRERRGLYSIQCEVLCEEPSQTEEHEITRLHTRRLEKDIIKSPEIWLWTHRRWKHKRPSDT
jgi:KDO2-lipid IV(A) lauroyltransferase